MRTSDPSESVNYTLVVFKNNSCSIQVKLPRRLEPDCFPHFLKEIQTNRTYYTSTSILGQIYDMVVRNVDGIGCKPEGMSFGTQKLYQVGNARRVNMFILYYSTLRKS